jgi:hypothetical protein
MQEEIRVRIPIQAVRERGGHGVPRLRRAVRCAHRPAALGMTILLWCSAALGTTYYVSNSGTDAAGCTTAATACKTLGYVNGSITLNPGDSVLLQRGGVWNEQLIPSASGMSGSPISFDAYGSGAAPLLTPVISLASATWTHNSGNIYTTTLSTAIASPQINNLQLGSVWGRKRTANPGCATAGVILGYGDFCVVYPTLYLYSPSGTLPSAYYSSIIPVVGQASGLAVVSIVGKSWLTFQHIEIQNFDYMGLSVAGASDNLVFANMEIDGMVPYGATPLGFYVNVSSGYGTSIQFLNDDAHLNYDGFRVDGATAVTVKNCRGYANRDSGLKDNTSTGTVVAYSYSHFYGNNVAQFPTSDVVAGIAGSGNISSLVPPVAVNFKTYPALFSFTVDDVGSSFSPPGTEAYINTFLTMFTSRGLYFNAAVVPSYTVNWADVNSWYAAGNEIDSHSWSHQYYSTNTDPCGTPPCSPPYANYPALDMQYTGSGTAATLTISGNVLSTSVTGASGDNLSVNLSVTQSSPTYTTMSALANYLMSVPHYTVTYDNGGTVVSQDGIGPLVRPNTHTTNLLNVSGQDIRTASFKLLYDQTKLEPDEMASSITAMQSNVTGLTEKFYVYPAGIEDPTIEPYAVAAGYIAARGSLSMKDQANETLGANSLYSNGVNVQNITSLSAIQIHGLTQVQISQMAASLVFRAAAWGAPYGFFTHWDSRGDSTPDISNAELGYLLDGITAGGGVWLTNLGLASAVTSGTGISGTTRWVQNPTGAAVNLAVAAANSPTVARGVVTGYPIDLHGMNRSALGAWDVGASAYLSQRYGAGTGAGTTHIGGFPLVSVVQLPQNWVNSNERAGTTSNTISFPSTGTGGGWTCGATNYGPYTAGSQASLQQAVNDAESCRTANGSGTTIAIPPAVYSGTGGLTLPQTAGDTSSNFIVLTSTSPLPTGQTVCSHGIQDNVSESTQPGIRNLGCNGSSMSYQLGTTVTTVSAGAFTLANGTATNTSAYNDVASMYTIQCTQVNCDDVVTAVQDANGISPHHYAILNGEFRPLAGLSQTAGLIAIGQGTETAVSKLPTHIHFAYDYIHGDVGDAPVSGGVATGPPTGSNSIANDIALNGCVYCSISYSYVDKSLRPQSEGHVISINLGQTLKIVHNWFEGQAIGILTGGLTGTIAINGFNAGQDVEERGNRYTYPYSWILAKDQGYYLNSVFTTSGGTGSGAQFNFGSQGSGGQVSSVTIYAPGTGYSVNDVLTLIQGTDTTAQVTVSTINGGGGVTAVTVTTAGSGYQLNTYVRKNAHETKAALRWLDDGNILENSDNGGGQGGQILDFRASNASAGNLGNNYWVQTDDITFTNNVLRSGCSGPLLGSRSSFNSGDGGGVTEGTDRYSYINNLLYNITDSNPGCEGASASYGFRLGGNVAGAAWAATAVRDSLGLTTTLTLTSTAGGAQTDTQIGDPVQVTGCTNTSFNTTITGLGPAALTGTNPNGLTVVYSNPGTANQTDSTCTYNSIQGYVNHLTFSHNTHVDGGSFDIYNAQDGGSTPYMQARNTSITNSLFLNSAGTQSVFGEGTRTQKAVMDPSTETFNNMFIGDRGGISCPGFTGAACYTEYGGSTPGSPPTTIYLTPTSACSGNDPVTGNCAGVLAAMSTGVFPIAINDWHNYRLCHSADAACNNTASLYASGGTHQATDGTDLGVATAAIDTAETRNIYPCASACGSTGPYADH